MQATFTQGSLSEECGIRNSEFGIGLSARVLHILNISVSFVVEVLADKRLVSVCLKLR